MYFLGGRYYRHRHNTHYICKWYYPLKKKDPSLITGYQLYREEIRERIAKSSPHLSTRGILKQVRRSWKLLPENQKDYYRRREITEQHSSERCRSTLAFRKGTKPSPSTLISYSDHSAWCEFHGANARLEQTGAKKLNAYGFRKSHGRFDRAYDHQIGFEDGEQSGDRTPETGDRWPDEGGEQGASEVADPTTMFSNGGVALKLVFDEQYEGVPDSGGSDSESDDESIKSVELVPSRPEPECICIED